MIYSESLSDSSSDDSTSIMTGVFSSVTTVSVGRDDVFLLRVDTFSYMHVISMFPLSRSRLLSDWGMTVDDDPHNWDALIWTVRK